MKKILSFAVALVMLLTMSIPTFAIYDGASASVGSVDSGYTPTGTPISSVNDFINNMPAGGTYYLTKDLDFSGTTYTTSIWDKTGDLTLDGCGYSLTGITINGSGDVGVFYDLRVGTIKNLNVEAEITTGTGACAGLTALSKGGYDTIFNNVKLNVKIKGGKIGGFCGYAQSGGFQFINCEVNGTIDGSESAKSGENGGVGGFLGQSKKAGTMEYCTNNATVIGNDTCTGGFIGRIVYGFVIDDSLNYGNVSNNTAGNADSGTAGFIGTAQAYTGSKGSTMIRGCKNIGTISGGRDAGGFIASVQGTSVKGITVQNCINEGDVTGGMYYNGSKGAKAAGIVAEVGTMDILISGCANKGAITGGTLYDDDGVGAIIGGAQTTSTTGTWELSNNSNEGVVTNTKEHTKVSTLAGFTAAATVEASGNTSTTKAVGTLATAGKAYIQFAEADTTSDVRFILALDESAVANVDAMNLKVSIGDVSVNFDNFGSLYRKLYAADLDIKGGDGVVLYGLIVTGVPNDVWSEISIELSATDSTGTAIDALSVTGTYTK